jgi:hypothetical protein
MTKRVTTSPSLAEVALANFKQAGRTRTRAVIDTSQACALVWAWAKVTRDLGHEPTRREYGAYWHQTERQLYRELLRFRVAFPTEHDPQNLANYLNAAAHELTEAGAMQLASPPELVPA